MKYSVSEEIFGEPTTKLDGDDINSAAADILADFTGLEKSKIEFFLKNFGLKAVLYNPSIMGISEEQTEIIEEIRELLNSMSNTMNI